MKRISLLFSIVLLHTLILQAQNVETGVRGRVVDENKEPIGFATLTLFSVTDSIMKKAGYSEDDGSFSFIYIQPGTYYLNISFVGYDVHSSTPFVIQSDKITVLGQIEMIPFATQLGEVIVASTRPVIEVKPDKTVFNVEGSINAIGNDALELLRKAPGVVVDNNEQLMLIGKTGVRVYIDGKQSILKGNDLANYLKTLQSTQIEAIEVITQPSSRYEAEGNAGIINIRLIKDKSLGTNATISLNHNQAKHGRSNGNLSINNRTRNLNVFGNINIAQGANSNFNDFERITPGIYADQNSHSNRNWDNKSLRAGADLTTGKFSTLGVLVDGYLNDDFSRSSVNTRISPALGIPTTEILLGSNDIGNHRNNYNANLNYRLDKKNGTVLNLDADYGTFSSDGDSYQPNFYYDATTGQLLSERIFNALTETIIDIQTFKLDYEKNLLGGSAGAGFKIAMVNTNNDYQFFDIIDESPVVNIDRTNQFDYTENINAGYVNYKRQWKKIGLQLGVRVEQTDSKGELTSLKPQDDQTVKQDYIDVFPSGGLTYQLHQKHTLRLTYSRRIDRPSYQDLNPFEFQLDELTFQKGNPFLRPQYSNSIQVGHTYNYTLNTTLTYTRTNNLMAQLTDTASTRAAFITTANVAEQDVYSLGISYPFAVSKAWNVFANASVSNTHNRADFGDDKIVDIRATTFNIYAQNSFILPKNFTLELSGWYNSPGIWGGNFATDEIWAIDAGIQKKIWKNRGNIKLGISDIFFSQQWAGENHFGGLSMKASGGWESRQVKMNFTYLMGNTQVKGSRRRATGLEAESKRIKSEN